MAPEYGGDFAALTWPAVIRYDADSDSTLLVPTCFYCANHTGFVVRGDATSAAGGRVHLRELDEDAWTVVPIDPALYGTSEIVSQAHQGPFEVVSAWPRLLMLLLAPPLVLAGSCLLVRAGAKRALFVGSAALIGSALIVTLGMPGDGSLFLLIVGMPAAIMASGLLAILRRTRPGWPLPLLTWAVAMWTVFQADPYFPSNPVI